MSETARAYQDLREPVTATIASGQSLSEAVDLNGKTLVALQMPAGWTAASLTFEASADGTTYAPVYKDDGTEYGITVAASRYIPLEFAKFLGMRFLKVRSGTSGAAVNQGAERTLTLIARAV